MVPASTVQSRRSWTSIRIPATHHAVLHKLRSQRRSQRARVLSPIQPRSTQRTPYSLIRRRFEMYNLKSSNLDQLALELTSFRQKGHLIEYSASLADFGGLRYWCTPEALKRNRIKLSPIILTSLSANALQKRLGHRLGCVLSRVSAYP